MLAVDRLDYGTLHLEWLPLLDRTSACTTLATMDIQALLLLFKFFMVFGESAPLIQNNDFYSEKARLSRSVSAMIAFSKEPRKPIIRKTWFKAIEGIVSSIQTRFAGFDAFYNSLAFTSPIQFFFNLPGESTQFAVEVSVTICSG